jgi:hypothetical protein|tara:strand:- start:1185 stop:2375 length:1191 start_codon:yes stop_codon:yes gene_type:complete
MEENNENVVEEVNNEENETVEEQPQEQEITKVNLDTVEDLEDSNVIRVNLDNINTEEDAIQEQDTDEVSVRDESETSEEVREQDDETRVEEVTEESEEQVTEEVEQPKLDVSVNEKGNIQIKIPGNLEKLNQFMEETGGSLEDYVALNRDYSDMDNDDALREYYRKTKPHLSGEEISFLMEDQFNYDEEVDDDREIRRKKLALKEQVANAKAYLDGQKSKYYEEVKANSNLTKDQEEAINFFNNYKKEEEAAKLLREKQESTFLQKTNNVFNDKFKGFEYNVGEKRFRFNVKNTNDIKNVQSDINNFVNKFVGNDGFINDAKGYHKALYSAMNADAIAQHFYDQGKADALKESVAKSKNVSMEPRQTQGEYEAGGVKVKVLGQSSSDFKFKIKNKN